MRIVAVFAGSQAEALCRTMKHRLSIMIFKKLNDSFNQLRGINLHFKQIVRRTCITPSVLSSHSPPLPLTILPIPEVPATISLPSSIMSAFVQATIIGTPAKL
jgi:hypothetical protein